MHASSTQSNPESSVAFSGTVSAEGIELELEAERIARELKLPPCPTLLDQFHKAMNDDEADQSKLVKLVSGDLALSAAVLKTVNSPAYGLSRTTSSIQQALTIIGLRATSNLLSRLLFRQAFPAGSGATMQNFWQESSTITDTSMEIARQIRGLNADEATTYMVFRDCGMAVMINRFPDYAAVWQAHCEGRAYDALKMEQQQHQTNHAHVGYALAKEWRVPESLSIAILCHHEIAKPSGEPLKLRGAPVKLAAFGLLIDQIVALRKNRGITADWEIAEGFALTQLGISPDDMVGLISG